MPLSWLAFIAALLPHGPALREFTKAYLRVYPPNVRPRRPGVAVAPRWISPLPQDLSSLLVECARNKILSRAGNIKLLNRLTKYLFLSSESQQSQRSSHTRGRVTPGTIQNSCVGRLAVARNPNRGNVIASLKCTQYSLSARAARALAHGPTAYGSPLPPYPQ